MVQPVRWRGASVIAVFVMAAVVCFSHTTGNAAETPIPPPPSTYVSDTAGALSESTRQQLDARLAAYQRQTGHQVIVYIGNTTGDAPLEDWTIRAFTAWKVGRKGLNDGAALFIFMQDHKLRIEVGYGLEPVLTDATASRIARNEIAARMKGGDVDAAVTAGVGAMLATIGGEHGQYAARGTRYSAAPDNTLPLWIFFGTIFIILMTFGIIIRAATRGSHRWYSIGSGVGSGLFWGSMFSGGGSSGGGGGDFGGFSGGGGMGGGGGASASW